MLLKSTTIRSRAQSDVARWHMKSRNAVCVLMCTGVMIIGLNACCEGYAASAQSRKSPAVVERQQPVSPQYKQSSNEVNAMVKELYQKGYTAFSQRHYEKAVQLEDAALKHNPSFEPAYNVKGIALMFAGKYDEGMKCLEHALKLNPNDGYALFNKALGLELYAHYNQAVQTYCQALRIKTKAWWQAWCYYGIASIYGRRGDVTNTVLNLKVAIRLNPATKVAARTEPDFNNVRNSSAFRKLVYS
jgi:tetratricopeptide (TPR) repeat protein